MVVFLQGIYCMKLHWYKRIICYIFIAILFSSGMHVEINKSHSYFACDSQTTSDQQYHNTQALVYTDYCTNELLRPRNTQHIQNNSKQNNVIRRTQHILCNLNSKNTFNSSAFELHYLPKAISIPYTSDIILEYIHRQDGAK